MARLTPLEDIRIEAPCPARWGEMKGDDRSRACESCGCRVHDLSAMTRDEAISLASESSARLCLRVHRQSDGAVITRDRPWVEANPSRGARVLAAGILGLASLVLTLLAGGLAPETDGPTRPIGPGLQGWLDWANATSNRQQGPSMTLGMVRGDVDRAGDRADLIRRSVTGPGEAAHDRSGGPEAVDGRADDPPGVPGPFAAGVEAGDGRMLAGRVVAGDPDGR